MAWRAVLGCLCALAVFTDAAVVPTQDTLIVSRSDAESTASAATLAPKAEVTTEGPTPPIKMTEMDVQSRVTMRYAHTAVTTSVRNPASRAQEAVFRVLLPETAFISGFTMTIDGKSYKAYVKEKEEAKQIYNEAVSQGVGAAHIAAKARDSNHFTVSVNIEGNSSALFNLTYEELLVRRNGVYNHAINLHPGKLVPKLSVTVHITEGQKLTVLRVPEVRTGNEIDATENDAQNPQASIERSSPDSHEAVIKFKPDLEEQKRLMEVYAQKTKESQAAKQHSWYDSEEDEPTDGILGQFVVQYDVDRPKDGEVLVNDGYFVYFYAPKDLPPLAKYVVFVLDTSGSMMDRKIVQLREAMQTILSELNPADYFSIVEFASSVAVHDLKEADDDALKKVTDDYTYYNSDTFATLVPPFKATPENIAKAKIIVEKLTASGSTNIDGALAIALQLVHRGVGWTEPVNVTIKSSYERTTVPAIDVEHDAARTTVPVNNENLPAAQPQTANNQAEKNIEPIIIFLTDGDPTVGETDPKRIITHLSELNYGENKATIYSLAFGEDADRKFLRKLSLRNEGFMRHIYEAADAALQLHDFFKQVSSPALAQAKFEYPREQIKEGSVTKSKFRVLYTGSEAVVAGRLQPDVAELTPTLSGFCGVDDGFTRKRYELTPRVPVRLEKRDFLPLERLWAYLSVKQLLDQKDADEASDKPVDKENGPAKKALELALKYEFVTPLTSLVVVKPNATKAVDAESVDDKKGSSALYYQSASLPGAPSPSHSYAQSVNVDSRFTMESESEISETEDIAVHTNGWGIKNLLDTADWATLLNSEPEVEADYAFEGESDGIDRIIGGSAISSPSNVDYNGFQQSAMLPVSYDYAVDSGDRSYGGFAPAGYVGQPGLAGPSMGFASYGSVGAPGRPAFSHYASSSWAGQHGPAAQSAGFASSHFFLPPRPAFSHYPGVTGIPGLVNRRRVALKGAIAHSKLQLKSALYDIGLTTPLILPTQMYTTSTPTVTQSPLSRYHLEQWGWALPLLDATSDELVLPVNGTNVHLKLSQDLQAPKESTDASCSTAAASSADGATASDASGACVYLTRCASAAALTPELYAHSYCTVNSLYAGVCCPTDKIDLTS